MNTVFQDYALFPHMSILDNVAYGLMVKGVNKKAAARNGARGAGESGVGGLYINVNRHNFLVVSASGLLSPEHW